MVEVEYLFACRTGNNSSLGELFYFDNATNCYEALQMEINQVIAIAPYPVFALRLSDGTLQKPDRNHAQVSFGKIWDSQFISGIYEIPLPLKSK